MVTAVSTSVLSLAAPVSARAVSGQIVRASTADVVHDSYVVVFKDTVGKEDVGAKAAELSARFGGHTGHVFLDALRGFEVSLPEAAARRLAADPAVAYVQENEILHIDGSATQTPTPSWGLDRIDQRALPLNNSYTYPTRATAVKAYVIDTGIRFSHTEFGGRAISGVDEIDGGTADDGHGHGTHVAATIGGKTYGVAKNVQLVAVRVLGNDGSGSTAGVIAGVDWVTADHQPNRLAVANMSLGGGINTALDTAVRNSIADGITYGIAAGNNNGGDACKQSPARVAEAITVGATTINDARASFSNIGTCIDIFAPGQDITSAWRTSDTATNTISGTSMATPHVVGAAAIALARNPFVFNGPAGVRDYLVQNATSNKLTNAGTGSPNKLLFVENLLPAATGVNPPTMLVPTPIQGGLVGVGWIDTSVDEDGFAVYRTDLTLVLDEATVSKENNFTQYGALDVSPMQQGPQCYFVLAYNSFSGGTSEALCVGD
jgi:subtilisin family serine protease